MNRILKKLLSIITQRTVKPKPQKVYQSDEHIEREYLENEDEIFDTHQSHILDAEYQEWRDNISDEQLEADLERHFEWQDDIKRGK